MYWTGTVFVEFFSSVLTILCRMSWRLASTKKKEKENTCFVGARFIGILIEIMKLKQTEEAMNRCTHGV